MLPEFHINPAFLSEVTLHKEWSKFDGRTTLTEEEIIEVLKGTDKMSSTWSEDHPEFTKFRHQLRDHGFIYVEHAWFNGDRVLKPFKLNGATFSKNSKFVCAAAMKYHLKNRGNKK